jgi:hypothetical protein
MKNILSIIVGGLVSANAFAQATLPASWNFDDPQPVGWTENLDEFVNGTRYTNGLVGAACKIDADDEFVMVEFSDVCGGVTYYIKGQGSASNDVFSVQESVDGNTWTDLRVFNESDLTAVSSAFTEFTDVPQAASRFVRWYFTDKRSGRNVGLDEISLSPQIPTLDQEIGISVAGQPVVTGSTYIIGNAAQTVFTIENVNLSGGNPLNVSDMQITGANASEFTISGVSAPFTVAAESTQDFNIDFSTVETGTRTATLTITNDDANGDETSFVINLYAIGGDYATEPADQPTNFVFSNVTSYGYDVAFDAASSVPENYIVLRSIGAPISAADNPVDGTTYVKGDYINNTQVVHVGPADSFRPSYVVADTDYYFAAYAFNGAGGYENYLTGAPLTGNVTSSGSMVGNYYDGVDPSSANFLTDLQNKISQDYSQIFYGSYAPIMIDQFASRDTTDGQKVVTDVYSGYQYVYSGAFFYNPVGELSREHSWPHSWMPTYPDQEGFEYSDIHNLFPTHQNNSNAVRSNRPLGEVEAQESSFFDAQYGDDINGNRVYEPRDQHKGDAARAIFYMAVKWNGTGGTWELPNPIDFIVQYGQDQDVLKQWHWQDPPDAWEIARNDFIESEQGNRNPFVDSVDWVCYIDFETLTYIGEQTTPCTVTPSGIEEQLEGDFSISPNPTDGFATLNLNLKEGQQLTINILDVTGRIVSTQSENYNSGMSREQFDLSKLDAGVYHVIIQGETARTTLKLIRQ